MQASEKRWMATNYTEHEEGGKTSTQRSSYNHSSTINKFNHTAMSFKRPELSQDIQWRKSRQYQVNFEPNKTTQNS